MKFLDKFKTALDIKNTKNKFQSIFNKSFSSEKTLGKNYSMFSNEFSYFYSNRNFSMTKNMDEVIDKLKASFDAHTMLNRVIQNISQKVISNDFVFTSENINYKKIKQVEERFKTILKNSNYNEKSFFKEHIINLIKYSNSFSIPFRDSNGKLNQILIVQNKGWHVNKSFGTSFAKEFCFNPDGLDISKIYKNEIDIWHYYFNKESDEIFGMPLWISVIPVLRKHSFLLNTAMDSYNDQSLEKSIYMVGVSKNGTSKPVTPESYKSIRENLSYPDSDLITDVPINVETLKKSFSSPDKIIDSLENQIVAGLYSSKSQLGLSSSGRQDSETQQENTNSIIEDFKVTLQNFLNNTLIKEICFDLFGNNYGENDIVIKFNEDFNLKERKEKHATYLFQAGMIDLKEARSMCGLVKDIDNNFTFKTLYGESEVDGTVENTNNPANQHGTTHTTKKTKKD
jgi:hypothetical protein